MLRKNSPRSVIRSSSGGADWIVCRGRPAASEENCNRGSVFAVVLLCGILAPGSTAFLWLFPKFPYTQPMKYACHLFTLALLLTPPQRKQTWTANIGQIRQASRMIPGPAPLRINVLKFAESRRAKKFSVKGAPDEPSVQARTVFQIMYADGYVMLDSGMDQQVHNFFGRGVAEPFDPEAAKQVERAVRGARAIIVTHEHGDHVAGVIHTPFGNELASKTILTRDQVQTLLTNPQMPEIKLT